MRCGHCSVAGPLEIPLEAFLVATGVVALCEMGDKTQIATVAPAARYLDVVQVVLGTTLA